MNFTPEQAIKFAMTELDKVSVRGRDDISHMTVAMSVLEKVLSAFNQPAPEEPKEQSVETSEVKE